MRRFDRIALRLARESIPFTEVSCRLESIEDLCVCDVEDMEQLRLMGLPLVRTNDTHVTLATRLNSVETQRYCVVDIECNASDPAKGQMIEVGAVMLEGREEVGRFESLVHAKEIPPVIETLTGIGLEDVREAPSLGSVLEAFRLFLGDAVFVAHNVGFDYYFMSASFEQQGFGPMLNRKLCTIDLAQKTIESPRYGLDFLKEVLGIEEEGRHRALADAKSAAQIFIACLDKLPPEVCTAEDLIYFSKPNPKKRKLQPPKT
ncbi:MAG: 3'-5' exonuclease [Campylobacterales bacterium]|nr:3'-5' exonuclease [Campylobacterales bacterium]